MASLKDIKRRIKSVTNSRKITYAMKLVSAAKLKKAQDAVTASRAYTEALGGLLRELGLEGLSDVSHPLMESRSETKNIAVIVIGGSRGLCGAFNSNINKRADALTKELSESNPGAAFHWYVFGKKPAEHFRRSDIAYKEAYEGLPEDANLWPIDEVCRDLENTFVSGQIDEAYLIYTRFKSAMSQSVMAEKILPMDASLDIDDGADQQETEGASGQTLFEPSAAEVFQAIVPRILRTKVRQAGLDSKASEHGSRMVAMDSATTNAGELVQKLTLFHNRLRQGAITAELLDIIGGAEALND